VQWQHHEPSPDSVPTGLHEPSCANASFDRQPLRNALGDVGEQRLIRNAIRDGQVRDDVGVNALLPRKRAAVQTASPA